MTDEASLGRADLRDSLARLGEALDRPVDLYLFGGCAMVLRGQRDTTKDVDGVVGTDGEYDAVRDALGRLGFEPLDGVAPEPARPDARATLVDGDDRRYDLFHTSIVDGLVLSAGMRRRSDPALDAGALTVWLLADVDNYLVKAISSRASDIRDINAIARAGIDPAVARAELDRQRAMRGWKLRRGSMR